MITKLLEFYAVRQRIDSVIHQIEGGGFLEATASFFKITL